MSSTGFNNDTLIIGDIQASGTLSIPIINSVTTWDATSTASIKCTISIINAQTDTSYTLTSTDFGKTITLSNAMGITLTCPEDETENLPVGFNCVIVQLDEGQVTVAKEGTDVLRSADSFTKLRTQYSSASITKLASGVWLLAGDLSV